MNWKALCTWGLFVGAFAFYTRNAAPSVTAGDSGEFITAAATLSLPHSPSFPLYVIAARDFISLVPFGAPGYRCNLFSAFTSALTLVVLLWIGWGAGLGMMAGLTVPLLLAVSASFWENSLVTEVFSLNMLMGALMTWVLLNVTEARASRWWLAIFLMGLGAGNHQVVMFVAPLFAVVAFLERRWIWQRTLVMGGVFAFFVGFSIYLVLPIRSAVNPPLNWGQPTTVAKLTHTILRKDYGTLTLALGEKPDRSFGNSTRHVSFFFRKLAEEVSLPLMLVALGALAWGLWRRERFAFMMAAGFVFSGPFFIWLGNLPLTAQSEGIIGRFLILPAFFLLAGLMTLLRQFPKPAALMLTVLAILEMNASWSMAEAHRGGMLVLDYGRSMLRSLPAGSALFMDGGDDAFYSLAMLQFVDGKRPDIELHDRGGLVFPTAYGDDFRALPKAEKPARRELVEKARLAQKPLYYVTMDPHVLPGVPTTPNGLVVQTTPVTFSVWPLYALRSLYPPAPPTFRTTALAAFFPFALGQMRENSGDWKGALAAYDRALQMGSDVDWLKTNLSYDFAQWGYRELMAGRLDSAEAVYRHWILLEPASMQAQSNLGVVLEKQNRLPEARAQYELTAQHFPKDADALFNLSVLAWKRGDWPDVVRYLEEVLRRDPNHVQARAYLMTAQQKLNGGRR